MGTEGARWCSSSLHWAIDFAPGVSEDKVMEVALEAGADDVITDEDGRRY